VDELDCQGGNVDDYDNYGSDFHFTHECIAFAAPDDCYWLPGNSAMTDTAKMIHPTKLAFNT